MVNARTESASAEGRAPEDVPEVTDATEAMQIVGDRGLSMWAGYMGEEYFAELKPWAKEAKFILEARDETTISTMLDAVKMPMIKAEIGVEPASDDAADVAAADFLLKNLNQMYRQSLRKWLTDTLESIEFGFALSEIVLEKRSDGRIWIRNLEPRGQETLRRWGVLDQQHPDTVTDFIQGGWRGGAPRREVAIPLDKCLHTTLRGRKGNPQGKSFLRSLYIPFKYMKNYRALEGIGIERDIGGTPMLNLPEGVGLIDNPEMAEIKKQMEGLRNDKSLYVILPFGMDVKPYQGSKQLKIRAIIEAYEKQILMRMFAQFLTLGMQNVGTQALVEGSQDFFTLALESIQDEIMEQVNYQLVPYLFRFNNFPGTTGLPKVTWAKPGKMDVAAVLEMFSKGAVAKIFTPTRDDEQKLRDELGLDLLPDGVGEGDRIVVDPALDGAPLEPFAPAGLDAPGVVDDIQDSALNGAQISSLVAVVQAVANGELPPIAAKRVLRTAFPTLSDGDIEAIIADAVAFDPTAGASLEPIMNRAFSRVVKHYDAGQDLRGLGGSYEEFTNAYQKDLVKIYDKWAVETTRLAALPSRSAADIDSMVSRRLTNLSVDLKLLARERIGTASGLGLGETLGKRSSSPEVQKTVSDLIRKAETDIDTRLIPGLKERYASTTTELRALPVDKRKGFLDELFAGRRSRIAQSAGHAQVAIFETQAAAGKVENAERKRLGVPSIQTRWVLDHGAEHCEDDPSRATFGCPGLARVYKDGWDAMPTVPAGNVSCLGNCRCFIEADFEGNGNWQRIT